MRRKAGSASDAKTFEELADYMQREHGVYVGARLRDWDLDNIRGAAQAVEFMMREFPEVAQYVQKLDSGKSKGAYAYVAWDPMTGTSNINLVAGLFKTRDALLRQVRADGDYHPPNMDAFGLIAHEMGHALEFALAKRKTSDSVRLYRMLKSGSEARRIIEAAVDNVIMSGRYPLQSTYSTKGLLRQVSEYASRRDRSESLAECVADYAVNGRRAHPVSREAWRILKQEFS